MGRVSFSEGALFGCFVAASISERDLIFSVLDAGT